MKSFEHQQQTTRKSITREFGIEFDDGSSRVRLLVEESISTARQAQLSREFSTIFETR